MRKKKTAAFEKVLIFLVIMIFFLGVGIFLYPNFSNWYMEQHQGSVIQTYNETIEEIPDEALEREKKLVQEYNRELLDNQVVLTDPFDEEKMLEDAAQYEQRLIFDEAMAYIEIPSIEVNLPIYHGTNKETLEKGVGHLRNTSLPLGGAGTHCVLSAHTGLPQAKLFTDLEKLEKGDLFFIRVLGEKLAYEVDQILVVEPDNTSSLGIDVEKDYVTLVTCTPYGKNTHRLLVRGERVPYDEQQKSEEKEKLKNKTMIEKVESLFEHRILPAWACGILGAAVIVCVVLLVTRKRK